MSAGDDDEKSPLFLIIALILMAFGLGTEMALSAVPLKGERSNNEMRSKRTILVVAVMLAVGLPAIVAGPDQKTSALAAKAFNNPCSVQIWEDENFEDSTDVINGPGRWNNMRGLPGANKQDWGDEIDSLKVGSTATVTVCEDENFEDNCQTYGPGTEKTNLRGNPDMGDQIDSMEIKCQ